MSMSFLSAFAQNSACFPDCCEIFHFENQVVLIDSFWGIGYTRSMKRVLFLIIILSMLPVPVYSHPGKTDGYGGHRCLRVCEEWGLFYKEYHLHDREGRPIRVGRSRKVRTPEQTGPMSRETGTAGQEEVKTDPTKTAIIANDSVVTNAYEESLLTSNPLLYILVMLLLLLLVIRMNRKREEG